MSRTDAGFAIGVCVAPPLFWLVLDRLTMGLIDEHLISSQVFAAIPVLPGIIAEAPVGFWKAIVIELAIWLMICSVLAWLANRLLNQPLTRKPLIGISCLIWSAIFLYSIFDGNNSTNETERSLVVLEDQPGRSEQLSQRIRRIEYAQVGEVASELPDILLVVLESFRHELVDPDVMPNLASAADQGLWCRNHFSSGNATSHGMFSIVTGMDATWFNTSLRYRPPLNRLFRSAGYEIGFFAGHDDWRTFYMDGFLSDDHFDAFVTTHQNRLASDRRSIQAAMKFLNQDDSDAPRFAILYLYVTHAPYRSYAEDRLAAPAAEDGFLIPYAIDVVNRVWNRYKNSASTADRWIGTLLADHPNRLTIVTGDHGESFLEDGTIGHGSKISAQQNRTPAILVGPGVQGRKIDAPTIHSDLLPTLLAAAGIELSDSGRPADEQQPLFDGRNLLQTSADELWQRQNVTRDYLTDKVRLIKEF